MKLSNDTLAVLKNFSGINESVYIKKGNVIETVSKKKNILAKAEVKDSFDDEFGVYDLNNFLGVIMMEKTQNPEIEFDEKNIVIKSLSGRSKIKYRKAAKETIVLPPEKKITLTSPEVVFTLSSDDHLWMNRVANILNSPNIAFVSDGSDIFIETFDKSDDSSHVNSTKIGENTMKNTFKVIFNVENLKFIDGAYDVQVSSKGIAHFKNKLVPVEYWVTTETGSKYS